MSWWTSTIVAIVIAILVIVAVVRALVGHDVQGDLSIEDD